MTEDTAENLAADESRMLKSPALRWVAVIFGWIMVCLGAVGALLPLFPTTVFLLIGMWAFSISSPRFRNWLLEHRWLGPVLRAWHQHRAIPRIAKILSVTTMAGSVTVLALVAAWIVPVVAAGVSAPVALFIVSRPTAENFI